VKHLKRVVASVVLLLAALDVVAADAPSRVDEAFTAASIDDLRDVRRLLQDHVVDPKATNARGDTLLIAAIRDDAARVIDYLIAQKGTDLEATNAAGETALMIAAYRKKKDVVDKLLARDAEVNRTGWTPLHYAASVDARDIVALLLDHAAYIDAESPNKTTPLMMAARGGFDDLCHQLIEAGADPTPVNDRDLTASEFAKRANDGALAQWLDERAVAWREKYGIPSTRVPAARN
jgi:ankyrin repeat protein